MLPGFERILPLSYLDIVCFGGWDSRLIQVRPAPTSHWLPYSLSLQLDHLLIFSRRSPCQMVAAFRQPRLLAPATSLKLWTCLPWKSAVAQVLWPWNLLSWRSAVGQVVVLSSLLPILDLYSLTVSCFLDPLENQLSASPHDWHWDLRKDMAQFRQARPT